VTAGFFNYRKLQIFNQASKKINTFNLKTIWITWSYGKSSVKEFLYVFLNSKYKVFKTPANINTEIWISQLILKNDLSKYNIFIAELWAYRKWEVKQSSSIINTKDAFITAIWNQHIWLFWSQQNIIDAKFEIWENVLKNNWKLYINLKLKPKYNKIILENKKYNIPSIYKKLIEQKQVIYYWIWEISDYNILIQEINNQWTYFKFMKDWKDIFKWNLFVNILWIGQLENLCGVIAYLVENWFSVNEIKIALKNIVPLDKSLKVINKETKDWKILVYLDDTYNLSINSLLNGVDLMNNLNGERVLVMDDILELWKDAFNIHYNLWKKLVWKIDKLFYVWVNYKNNVIKWLKDNGFDWEILDKFPSYFLDNTIILLEGRRAWKYVIKKHFTNL